MVKIHKRSSTFSHHHRHRLHQASDVLLMVPSLSAPSTDPSPTIPYPTAPEEAREEEPTMEEKPTVEKESTVEAPAEAEEAPATKETSTAKEAPATKEAWATGVCTELLGSLGRDHCTLRNSLGSFHSHARCNGRLCSHSRMTIRRALREDASSYETEAHRQAKTEGNNKFSQFQHRVSSTFCVQVPSSSRVNLQNALRKAHAPGACTCSSQAHERPSFLSRA